MNKCASNNKKCRAKFNKTLKNKVSKIMESDAAQSELSNHKFAYQTFQVKQNLSKEKRFIMEPPEVCRPDPRKIAAIRNCGSGEEIRKNLDDYHLLVMQNGGLSLADIHKKRSAEKWTPAKKLGLLRAFQNILNGLVEMEKAGFLHHDIKPQNILYDDKKKQISLIDFGLSRAAKSFIASLLKPVPPSGKRKSRRVEKLRPGYHFSYSKEHHFMAKGIFDEFADLLRQDPANLMSTRIQTNLYAGKEYDKAQSTYFRYAEDSPRHRAEVAAGVDAMLQAVKRKLVDEKESSGELYLVLLQKHLKTFDTFSMGFTILFVLHNLFSRESQVGGSASVGRLRALALQMCTPNLFERIVPEEASAAYESIMRGITADNLA
jgi:serine/threonine protein kinase